MYMFLTNYFFIYNFSTGKSHCQRDSEHWNCGSSLEITESLAFRSIFARFLLHHNFLRFKKNSDYILLSSLTSIFVRFNFKYFFLNISCRISNILSFFFCNFVQIFDNKFQGVRLAQKFEALVLADARFEIPATRHLGLVVFRLRGENSLTERLLKKMNSRGRVHCVPAALHGKYVIRFTVTSTKWVATIFNRKSYDKEKNFPLPLNFDPSTTNEDILRDWAEIRNTANEILDDDTISPVRAKVPLAGNKETNRLIY